MGQSARMPRADTPQDCLLENGAGKFLTACRLSWNSSFAPAAVLRNIRKSRMLPFLPPRPLPALTVLGDGHFVAGPRFRVDFHFYFKFEIYQM